MIKFTLCWDCKKATGGCVWSDSKDEIPVPGWKAEQTKLRLFNTGTVACSYAVVECPEFERDAVGGGLKWLEKRNGHEWISLARVGKGKKERV